MTKHKLAENLNCSIATLGIYLARSEFSHIKKVHIGHKVVFSNIVEDDIEKLKKLVNRKRGYKIKNEHKNCMQR